MLDVCSLEVCFLGRVLVIRVISGIVTVIWRSCCNGALVVQGHVLIFTVLKRSKA